MGHCIEAFISRSHALEACFSHFRNACMVPLSFEFALLPVVNELFDEIASYSSTQEPDPFPQFYKLSAALANLAVDASYYAGIAYVETDYWGGTGTQGAVLWLNGSVAFGPLRTGHEVPLAEGAINSVLKRLGVRRGNATDEFEAIGLHRFRRNEDWVKQARS